jgi:hypothetical protein
MHVCRQSIPEPAAGTSPRRLAWLGALVLLGIAFAPQGAFAESLEREAGRTIAAEFVDAFNSGDEDAVLALFDVQATVTADRMVWRLSDLRRWISLQVSERINIQPTSAYEVVGYRVKWTARVFRRDWIQDGVDTLDVWESILVDDRHRILAFVSQPTDRQTAALLGDRWRPDTTPDPLSEPSTIALPSDAGVAQGIAGLFAVLGVLGGTAAYGRDRRTGDRTRSRGLLVKMRDFAQCRRAHQLSLPESGQGHHQPSVAPVRSAQRAEWTA